MECSGTLRVQAVDQEWIDAVFGSTLRTPAEQLYGVLVATEGKRMPCPSPWHHPIRWLRWNPFLREPPLRWQLSGVEFAEVKTGIVFVFPKEEV